MIDKETPNEEHLLQHDRDPSPDARTIVRLFQCAQCSYPLQEPMTLPCGYSLCRRCLPPLYTRDHITYPANPGRAQGFHCPFADCGSEHPLEDCSMDVTLKKVLDIVKHDLHLGRAASGDLPIKLHEELDRSQVADDAMDVMSGSRVLHGGRLVTTYTLTEMGELSYHAVLSYSPLRETVESDRALDVAMLQQIKRDIRVELECQVCYSLMLDPLTTPCGHTFCRRCIARVLDHSNLCPACRRPMPMPPGVQAESTNKSISQLIKCLYPDLLRLRKEAAKHDDRGSDNGANIPLFPCTLAYPEMPTFLHIFEPRYRLMVRRAIESGDRQFGMLMYNHGNRPQGSLGRPQFVQYGTLLRIQNIEMFADGRSLVETKGTSRFKILETSMRDGYLMGKIQRIDDLSPAEEESLESRETSGAPPAANDGPGKLNHMSTQSLLQFGLDFISRAQASSEPWLSDRFLSVYGPAPRDPAVFPYWFASVLPITEEEKYQLLPTTSVRERLKIVARWIQRLEATRWYQTASCIVI